MINIKENKFERQTYWLMIRMIRAHLRSKGKEIIRFSLGYIPDMYSPTHAEKLKIIKTMEKWDLIKIIDVYDENGAISTIDNCISIDFKMTERFRLYFDGLSKQIDYINLHLEAIENGVEFILEQTGSNLWIKSPFGKLRVNDKPMLVDRTPYMLFNHLLNISPGRLLTSKIFEDTYGVGTTRNFKEVINKVGMTKNLREYFIPVFEKESVRLFEKRKVTLKEAQLILDELNSKNINALAS